MLLLCYVLTLNKAAATEAEAQAKARGDGARLLAVAPYSESFTRALPVKRLLAYVNDTLLGHRQSTERPRFRMRVICLLRSKKLLVIIL